MATLVFLILVIFLFFIFTRGSKTKKYFDPNDKENWNRYPSWKSKTPDPYYESAEYKKFCRERKKTYEKMRDNKEIGSVDGVPSGEQYGKKGGRYEMRYSKKTGKPYRHYF